MVGGGLILITTTSTAMSSGLPGHTWVRLLFQLDLFNHSDMSHVGQFGGEFVSPFLKDTLNANHFPNTVLLPSGDLFVAANTQAMIFNWQANTETRLPSLPNGVRVSYPFSGSHVLLPLSADNNYTPEILICGGNEASDTVDPFTLSTKDATSAQCVRMVLDEAGIAGGWQVESMPEGRVMIDLVLLPDGRVMGVNGALNGYAGYGNVSSLCVPHAMQFLTRSQGS